MLLRSPFQTVGCIVADSRAHCLQNAICSGIEKDKWAVAYLRPFRQEKLAKTGDSDKVHMLVEYTLEARNEKSSGKVADLTTS